MAVGEWDRARRIVRELAPDLEPYLEEKYRDAMANEGKMEQLAEVDGNAALEMMARKGQWSQLFEAASLQSPEVLHRFVARRAAQLLKSDSAPQALQLYVQYGAPAISQNFNLYLQLAESVLNATQQEYRYEVLSQDYTRTCGKLRRLSCVEDSCAVFVFLQRGIPESWRVFLMSMNRLFPFVISFVVLLFQKMNLQIFRPLSFKNS